MEENLFKNTRQVKRIYLYLCRQGVEIEIIIPVRFYRQTFIDILNIGFFLFSSFVIPNNVSSTNLSDGPIRVLWLAAFSLIMVISILGNSVVLWIVTGEM